MDYSIFDVRECNVRYKILPNGTVVEKLVCNQKIWHPTGELRYKEPKNKIKSSSGDNTSRSIRRAKNSIYDYVICNADLDLFVTLTLNKDVIDRYDYKAIIKKLNQWLDNRVRRNGLKYVIVPELHKDGAIHFHGFLNKDCCKLVDSGHQYKDGRTIYNLKDYKLGFTDCMVTVGERSKIANYICKYITKQADTGKIGGRFYLHSNNLLIPSYEYGVEDFNTDDGFEFSIDGTTRKFKKTTL